MSLDEGIMLLSMHSDKYGNPYLLGVLDYYNVYGLQELNALQIENYIKKKGLDKYGSSKELPKYGTNL